MANAGVIVESRGADVAARSQPPPSPLDAQRGRARMPLAIAGALAALMHGLAAAGALAFAELPKASSAPKPVANTELVEVALEPETQPASEPPEPARMPQPITPPRAARSVPREPPTEAAPAAAQAAQVLGQDPEDEVIDFGDAIVQGRALRYAGGVTEAGGTSQRAVRDSRARAGGMEGGTGTDTSGIDRSRPPSLAGGTRWDCPFPEEADTEGIDSAMVTLRVQVLADGDVERVEVVHDPGSGFGREARRCALRKRWQSALDRAGRALSASSLVNVRFYR